MKWTLRLLTLFIFVWSLWQMNVYGRRLSLEDFTDGSIAQYELALVVHALLVLIVLVVLLLGVRDAARRQSLRQFILSSLDVLTTKEVAVAAVLAFLPRSNVSEESHTSDTIELPMRSVVDPVVAMAILQRVLQRRKTQVASRFIPGRISNRSQVRMNEFRRISADVVATETNTCSESIEHVVDSLLEEEECDESNLEIFGWDIIIRMYGYPSVENRNGQCATFAKRRSLEVLSWLGMNQDRPRRSAVRTAIWDIEITDASFSTVLSDVRRGLSDVVSYKQRQQILPPTFTDAIELGVCITTDFNVLSAALRSFRENKATAPTLLQELNNIRDIPFAGANYMWADLDGTTTRMVVTAFQASKELAEWAQAHGEIDMCMAAVKAGLRVLPGCEELLAIQHSFISNTSMSQQRAIS